MEDAGRKGAAAAENGIEREGYVVFKAAATDWEGDLAADGGDRGDLAAPAEDTLLAGFKGAAAAAVTAVAEDKAAAPAKAPAKVSSAFWAPSTCLDSSSLKFF
jgi:hypothetical protein